MERVGIFVDGANFFYGLRSINQRYNDFHFDFEKLFKTLANGRKITGAWYYNAPIKGQPTLNHDHQKMMSRLESIPNTVVRRCSRQNVNPAQQGNYKMKMDDVWLCVDMVHETHTNKFDTIILISGDGDMKPAVEMVKSLGKNVEVVGFTDRLSYSLVNCCNSCKILGKKMIKKHFLKTVHVQQNVSTNTTT